MAGRSWPSLTSDALEHEWIGVHQLRLDRKRRRRASLPMRPPYCLVIRLNVAVNRALSKSGQVSWLHRSFSLIRRGRTSLSTEITTRPIGPRECADAPPFVTPELRAAHRVGAPVCRRGLVHHRPYDAAHN